MKNDKYLELEKLKFRYQYLNDTEKHNFFIYVFVVGIFIFPSIIAGNKILSVIVISLFFTGLMFIMSDIKKVQKEMLKVYKKIQKLK